MNALDDGGRRGRADGLARGAARRCAPTRTATPWSRPSRKPSSVATKNLDETMDEIKKTTSRARRRQEEGGGQEHVLQRERRISRNDAGVPRRGRRVPEGHKKTATLASLDKSIKEMETAIDNTCK